MAATITHKRIAWRWYLATKRNLRIPDHREQRHQERQLEDGPKAISSIRPARAAPSSTASGGSTPPAEPARGRGEVALRRPELGEGRRVLGEGSPSAVAASSSLTRRAWSSPARAAPLPPRAGAPRGRPLAPQGVGLARDGGVEQLPQPAGALGEVHAAGGHDRRRVHLPVAACESLPMASRAICAARPARHEEQPRRVLGLRARRHDAQAHRAGLARVRRTGTSRQDGEVAEQRPGEEEGRAEGHERPAPCARGSAARGRRTPTAGRAPPGSRGTGRRTGRPSGARLSPRCRRCR